MFATKYKNINPKGMKLTMGCSQRGSNQNSQQKTRMCQNIITSGSCQFGSSCHYAHTFDELRIMDCAYGGKCIFINYTDDSQCLNKNCSENGRLCYFRHPNETDMAYHIRVGNLKSRPKPQPICHEVTQEDPLMIDLNDTSWSAVVRRVPTSVPTVIEDKKPRSSNPYAILDDSPIPRFSPVDMEGIIKFVEESISQNKKIITIKID